MVTHLSRTGIEQQRISTVLDQFEELPVLVAAMRLIQLLISVFINQDRLGTIRIE